MAVMTAGRHPAKVVAHALGVSKTGTEHVAVLFENAAGDTITWYGYLSDKAIDYTLKDLGTLGWDPKANDGRLDSLNGTDLLVGHMVSIVVESETYDGETRQKVAWINKLGGGLKEFEPDKAEAVAKRLRQRVLTAAPYEVVKHEKGDQELPPAPEPAADPPFGHSAPAPGRDYDDDLPFAPLRLTNPLDPHGW